jgi:hypothetical protein
MAFPPSLSCNYSSARIPRRNPELSKITYLFAPKHDHHLVSLTSHCALVFAHPSQSSVVTLHMHHPSPRSIKSMGVGKMCNRQNTNKSLGHKTWASMLSLTHGLRCDHWSSQVKQGRHMSSHGHPGIPPKMDTS